MAYRPLQARIESLETDLKAVLRREDDANRAAMKHLRSLEAEKIKSANYAEFSTEWRKRCEALEAQLAKADALAEALTLIANAPSEMTWGEEAEVNETINKMEAIADAALTEYRAAREKE